MTTHTIKQLGAEFYHAADGVGEALLRLEHARADRLAFLRQCSKDSAARLAKLREEIRTLPEQIAKWDADAARLESQTAEDLLRQALEAGREAERALPRPVENCGHVAEDGTCGHPNALTPECHDWVVCPVKAAEAYCKGAWALGNNCKTCARCLATKPPPTLLDLTKLPPGTVCEATNFFPIYNSGKMMHTTDRFRTQRVASGELPVLAVVGEDLWWFPALVPARVVKEGGEDGQG